MIIQASSLTKDIYQPKDIAKILGCSVRTVQNYCDENKIISYRNVKNRRLVDKDKLIDFLQSIDCYIDDITPYLEINYPKEYVLDDLYTNQDILLDVSDYRIMHKEQQL